MLTKVFRPGRRRQRPRPPLCRLNVESLEDRNLLSFQVLGTLGTQVALPTGTAFRINDFEPNGLNNQGDIIYGDDLGTANDPSTFFGEGVFLRSHGQETVLGNATAPAPGGGAFDFGFLGPSGLNDPGDATFAFLLQPAGAPYGVNAGTYRYSHATGAVTPVVVPGVTPAPTGGTFAGTFFGPSINNGGTIVFPGIVPTDKGVHVPGQDYPGLGIGVFEADKKGHISSVVVPGDPAPGGGTFDVAGEYTSGRWMNDGGDIAFAGHIAGTEAAVPGFPDQSAFIATLGSVYFRDAATGRIQAIAQAGDAAPGGGVFRQAIFPVINNAGQVVFTGDLTPAPGANQQLGVFLYSGGKITAIARPGDAVPGGGHIVTTSVVGGQSDLNNRGDVVFNAALDTTHNGVPDTGLFQWSHGQLSLIARTGTVLPGIGTVDQLTFSVIVTPPPPIVVPNSGAVNNDRGQVFFGATLTDGRSVMLLYTPGGPGGSGGSARDTPTGSVVSPAAVGPGTTAAGRPATTVGASQSLGADLIVLLGGALASRSAGLSAALPTQPGRGGGGSLAVAAGVGGSSSRPASPLPAGLPGAPPAQAVDALFAGMGTGPFGDPLAGGPF